ncbi:MAG: hypothetical protein FJZ90_11795 [Chloroflexi bacterium]|nr:hypothetical protein [Chloroflexota bacterium]
MRFPFEATSNEIADSPDQYIDKVFSCLQSEFLVMPKGSGFIEYAVFERAYEALKAATHGFSAMEAARIVPTVLSHPIALVVLRTMLGFTPPEWAYIATQESHVTVSQGFARSLDRRVRLAPRSRIRATRLTLQRLNALVETACRPITEGPSQPGEHQIHRLDKADTSGGIVTVRNLAGMGVPYAMLLYERLLGRPFAGHRDSVSELIGEGLESAIEDVLSRSGISYRKTRRAERIAGFDQAPDFVVPSEYNPAVVIEAKITEDDGTARDKVTRIQHLSELAAAERAEHRQGFQVIACIGGRGFGVRREDMRKLLTATGGKVFTRNTLEYMVAHTRLSEYRTRP